MSNSDDVTDVSVTIPIPTERPRMYGVHSTFETEGAGRYYIRCNAHEAELIVKACAILEIKPAAFGRDIMVNVAERIVEKYNARNRSSGGG